MCVRTVHTCVHTRAHTHEKQHVLLENFLLWCKVTAVICFFTFPEAPGGPIKHIPRRVLLLCLLSTGLGSNQAYPQMGVACVPAEIRLVV